MRFTEYYTKRFIAHMDPHEFREALSGQSPDVSVTVIQNGSMLLKPSNRIVKCVCNYYKPVGREGKKISSGSNRFLNCQIVRDDFDIACGRMECRLCHRICMDLAQTGRLERK